MFMEIIFFIVLVILLAVSAGFGTNAAVKITGISNYKTNTDLLKAHTKLKWLSVIAWIGVAVIITAIILILVFDLEMVGGFFIYGLIILCLILLLVVGIYAAWAASLIGKANVKDDNKAKRQSIVSASLALGGMILIIIGMFIKIFVVDKDKKTTMSSVKPSSFLGKAEKVIEEGESNIGGLEEVGELAA